MWNSLRFVLGHPLNARGRYKALRRVVSWQIASRLMQGPIAFPFVGETQLFASRGMTGATGNWYCGLHEVNEMAFVLHALRPTDHFIDVGANIGSYTVLAGGAARSRVTAVEPIPATFAHLQRNIALNGLTERVRAHQVGLSDQQGTLRFAAALDTTNHVLAADEGLAAVDVPVMSLDELVGADTPLIIKIDVEGHELAVLRGARQTLRDERLLAVLMETNGSGTRYGVTDGMLLQEMSDCGFRPYSYDAFARRLLTASGPSDNTIFIRDPGALAERTRAAPRFRLINRMI
jgi:FkbM family methyltransferase